VGFFQRYDGRGPPVVLRVSNPCVDPCVDPTRKATMRKLRHLLVVVAVLAGGLSLTACGSDSDTSDSTKLSTKSIDVTIQGDSVTPNGDRVEVAVGQPVEFVVKADAAGEIHVHSDPEQELEYAKGTTILKLPASIFDRPGIIEVESHALEKTIVQLEVK